MQALLIPHFDIPEEDDCREAMKLRDDEKKWITGEISRIVDESVLKAADQFHPRGWQRVTDFVRSWGIASALIAIPITLLGITLAAVYTAVNRVEKQATFEANTTNSLSEITKHLQSVDSILTAIQLDNAGKNPIDKESASSAQRIIDAARDAHLQLPSQTIEQTGRKFIEAGRDNISAWNAALGFLNYKSFANESSILVPASTFAAPTNTFYLLQQVAKWPLPQFFHSGRVPKADAAALGPIGEDTNALSPLGDAYLFGTGGALLIDGEQFKNVVFRNVHIVYRGGPVILKNVYFVNCTFEMPQSQNTQNLAIAALSSTPAVSFAVSS